MAINGDSVIVGADGKDDDSKYSGSAYIFERDHGGANNWGQVTRLTASDASYADQFGISVTISGDTAIIGAYRDDDGGIESGSAYIFERNHGGANSWGQVTKLGASDAGAGDRFGYSVANDGASVIVGTYAGGDSSGSAYTFISQQTLTMAKVGTGTGRVVSTPAGINCGDSCSYNFATGTTVTLTHSADVLSTFAGWDGACKGTAVCVITMDTEKSVIATFNTYRMFIPFIGKP